MLSGAMKAATHTLSWGFVIGEASRGRDLSPDFALEIGLLRHSDLRLYGAPKGIRILVVLVLVGATWCLLVLKSCGESQ